MRRSACLARDSRAMDTLCGCRLMLGAAFLASHSQGRAATLAVLFHEVPHEIGDVAILMQA